ncbi:hypothetical protein DOTSEDRAFT_66926 [Dothistroma septosporum NZE10]|uniref:Uncharacterized protein n=1 Tax=Dothistroma septosporum (strain NZE10 / CBS 128990) TaxID=675120 RepID=M2XHN3_DOTSN|nr:hypothetical protein DOTSEDRAFT_66926 [Dothistroma septosporum NZE10]
MTFAAPSTSIQVQDLHHDTSLITSESQIEVQDQKSFVLSSSDGCLQQPYNHQHTKRSSTVGNLAFGPLHFAAKITHETEHPRKARWHSITPGIKRSKIGSDEARRDRVNRWIEPLCLTHSLTMHHARKRLPTSSAKSGISMQAHSNQRHPYAH